MAQTQRLRDRIPGAIDPGLIREREEAGWRMVAIEWERSDNGSTPAAFLEPPYGLRVAPDCQHLEEHPVEAEILRLVMQGVVNDQPLSHIAAGLNRRNLRTRAGEPWTPASVFRLMPALVESGPRIFSEPEWPERRKADSIV